MQPKYVICDATSYILNIQICHMQNKNCPMLTIQTIEVQQISV